jgi:hypothetical protein
MKDLIALLIIGIVGYDAATRKFQTRCGGYIRRKDHPFLYWIYTVVGIAFALVLLVLVIYDVYGRVARP